MGIWYKQIGIPLLYYGAWLMLAAVLILLLLSFIFRVEGHFISKRK
ncbi:MAG: hypothetical protein IJ001_06495 [Oscillospiraceae bacterium]|nr:hypothetical protein [Oscillospiraceae bacterium]